MNNCTCIIPFWNEADRLYKVLDEVVKTKSLLQIVCIDDASFQNRSDEIKNRYPNIQLIRLEKNLGKSGAIREALKFAKGHYILLLDADLRNLDHMELDSAVDAVKHSPDVDMLILRRIKAPFFVKLTRGDFLATGERIIKKEDLQNILKQIEGWQLESAINMYMYEQKKRVYWISHSGINTHWKWGLMTDLKYHRKKLRDMNYIGLFNLLKLYLFFGKNKLNINRS